MKEKLARAITEAETLDTRRLDEYTLGTWLQTWYELYAKPHLRFSTAEYYRRGIELHIVPRIGDIPLKKLTGRDLQWLYKDLQEHGRPREAQKSKQPGLSDEFLQSFGVISCGNRKSPGRFERINPKQPGPDMKKSRPTFKRFLKICLLFSLFCCLWGEKKIRKPGKIFFPKPAKGSKNGLVASSSPT